MCESKRLKKLLNATHDPSLVHIGSEEKKHTFRMSR